MARVSPDPLAGFLVMCCEEARSPLWIAPFWRMRMMAALRVQEGGMGNDEMGREQEEMSSAWLRLALPRTQNSLERLVLDVLVVAKEGVLNLLFGDFAKGTGVARRGRFELSPFSRLDLSPFPFKVAR